VEIRRPKIGLIGGGMMAQVGHLPFYLDDDRCEVVLVAEERPSLRAALAHQLGPDRIAGERHEVLRRADIDAVVLCAPRTATGPLTLEVLEAGKHVLVEKPMAHTIDQARRLVEAAAAGQRIYAVAFMKRYDPGVQAAKALLDEAWLPDGSANCCLHASIIIPMPMRYSPRRISDPRRAASHVTPCGPPYRIGSQRDGKVLTNGFSIRPATTSIC